MSQGEIPPPDQKQKTYPNLHPKMKISLKKLK